MRRIAPDVMSASFNPRDAAGTRAAAREFLIERMTN